jgi:hypothetical protein
MAKIAQLKIDSGAIEQEMIPYSAQTTKAGLIRIIVDGKTPLLTHNPESMNIIKEATKGSRIPPPEIEAEAGCYRTSDGTCALKGESFRGAELAAASAYRIKKASLRYAFAHIIVLEELVPLMRRDGTPISDYVIDKRRAIVQRQGIIRCRPRFDEWSAMFTFQYDPIIVTDSKLIVDVLQDAGGRIGVGDYRPARNGWFGRFNVRAYQVLD